MLHFSLHNIFSKINCCLDSIMLLLDSVDSIGLPLQASCALTAPLQGLYLWAVTPFYLLNPVTLIEINIRYFWFVIEIPCLLFFLSPFSFLFVFFLFFGGEGFFEKEVKKMEQPESSALASFWTLQQLLRKSMKCSPSFSFTPVFLCESQAFLSLMYLQWFWLQVWIDRCHLIPNYCYSSSFTHSTTDAAA